MDTSSVDLPDEIIELILSKCPAESVVRFQSVSKSWQSIISDPRFSRLHRIQRSKLPEDHNKFFLWRHDYGVYLIRLEDEKSQKKSDALLGYPSSGKFFEPLSSCDGLILLLVDCKEYMLWNPLIRKHIIIPTFNPQTHPQAFINWIKPYNPYPYPWKYHLYHDSKTDDYKIVLVYRKCYTVYSCKNGSWGEIKDLPCDWFVDQTEGIDGCLYCMSYDNSETICFDARDGKLHKFRQPMEVEFLVEVQLKAVSGRLCLYGFNDNRKHRRIHLWVMEENGSFENSWKKLISMKKKEPCIQYITPVYLTNKDDVVLWARVKTENGILFERFIYNPRRKSSFKEIDFTWDVWHQLFSYSENLDMPCSTIC